MIISIDNISKWAHANCAECKFIEGECISLVGYYHIRKNGDNITIDETGFVLIQTFHVSQN